MPDVIQLLPDSVANQIAAGEVIQRPASVIKELVENSVDSGATDIKIIVKDSGKTSIQVIDNGSGMSETDARLAFERHATSKIRKADDLFALFTLGFRGEALASIAAIAQVELKTRSKENELGTHIEIHGSELTRQELTNCQIGSNFTIKNLFYNVPARRKFLKSDANELKHIITEFERVALAHPEISFELTHNNNALFKLPVSNIKQRIVNLDKKSAKNLIKANVDTSLLKLTGYIGHPETAKKNSGRQFFFVNGRYMKHPYFHKAVMLAYEDLLPHETVPVYFLYLEVDPQTVDINIHPTKTEIKFENATPIFQILRAAIKESLGKFSVMPSIDFDMEDADNIPIVSKDTEIKLPTIEVDPSYNPFEKEEKIPSGYQSFPGVNKAKSIPNDWEKFYDDFTSKRHKTEVVPKQQEIEHKQDEVEQKTIQRNFIQLKNKYIITTVKSGLMLIDQKRAHERILFEKFLNTYEGNAAHSQQSLFPVTVEFSADDFALVKEISEGLKLLGFDINEFGRNTFVINGTPAQLQDKAPDELLHEVLNYYKSTTGDIVDEYKLKVIVSLAKASAIPYGKQLSSIEMQELTDQLFACSAPNYSPENKTIISIISDDDIAKNFKRLKK